MAIYSGFSDWKWWFSIAMLNYQRVETKKNLGFLNGTSVCFLFPQQPVAAVWKSTIFDCIPKSVRNAPSVIGWAAYRPLLGKSGALLNGIRRVLGICLHKSICLSFVGLLKHVHQDIEHIMISKQYSRRSVYVCLSSSTFIPNWETNLGQLAFHNAPQQTP